MIYTEEIVDLLIKDQESHEAIVRALHYDRDDFMEWGEKNIDYVSYALSSLGIRLPIYYLKDEDIPSLTHRNIVWVLWGEIEENKEEIKKRYNERFSIN